MTAFINPVLPTRNFSGLRRSHVQLGTPCTMSLSRRQVLPLILLPLLPLPARALSLAQLAIQGDLRKLKATLAKTKDLIAMVNDMKSPISGDNGEFVLRYAAQFIQEAPPVIEHMAQSIGGSDDVVMFGRLMKGHLLELNGEVRAGNKDGVLRELDEVIETIDDIFKLDSVKKYL